MNNSTLLVSSVNKEKIEIPVLLQNNKITVTWVNAPSISIEIIKEVPRGCIGDCNCDTDCYDVSNPEIGPCPDYDCNPCDCDCDSTCDCDCDSTC